MRFSKIVEEKEEISRDNWMGGFAHMQLSEVVGFLWKEAPVCYHFFHMICNFFCQWWWLYVSAIKVFHSCPRGLQPFNIYESSNIFENVFFFAMFCFSKIISIKALLWCLTNMTKRKENLVISQNVFKSFWWDYLKKPTKENPRLQRFNEGFDIWIKSHLYHHRIFDSTQIHIRSYVESNFKIEEEEKNFTQKRLKSNTFLVWVPSSQNHLQDYWHWDQNQVWQN